MNEVKEVRASNPAYYDHFTRDELIEHCTAYGQALHDLAHSVQKLHNRIFFLRLRLTTNNLSCDTHAD